MRGKSTACAGHHVVVVLSVIVVQMDLGDISAERLKPVLERDIGSYVQMPGVNADHEGRRAYGLYEG